MDEAWELDTWVARTKGEVYAYVEALNELRTSHWRVLHCVRMEALCFQQPLLRAEFRYLRKCHILFWDFSRLEHRTRSTLGYLVPYQMVEVGCVRSASWVGRYVPIKEHLAAVESRSKSPAELPPVLTYVGSHLVSVPYYGL